MRKCTRPCPSLLYCKQREAGQGPENEATPLDSLLEVHVQLRVNTLVEYILFILIIKAVYPTHTTLRWWTIVQFCANYSGTSCKFCDIICGGMVCSFVMSTHTQGTFVLFRCGNVNWARRTECNVCRSPKFGTVEPRTGL